MKRIKHSLLFILFCHATLAWAQDNACTYTLKGRIVDTFTLKPMPNTTVGIETDNPQTVISNAKGEFEIKNLCKGLLELHISHLNCEHKHLSVSIQKDSFITIYMHHEEQTLDGIVLTVKNERKEEMGYLSERSISLQKGNSVSQLLENLSGVSLLKTGNNISKPLINGLFGNRVLIINNGIRQEGQNWGMEHAPEMDAYLAAEIENLTGAEALRYGSDGIGGVLLLKPASIFKEKAGILSSELNLQGSSNGRMGNASAQIGSRLSSKIPLFWRVQGTLKQAGNSRTANAILANTGFQERDYSVTLGYKKDLFQSELFFSNFNTKIGIYSGSQVGNITDLIFAMNSKTPLYQAPFTYAIQRPYQLVSHHLLKWKSIFKLNRRNNLELNLSYQRNHRSEFDVVRNSNINNKPSFDYYISTVMGELLWTKRDFHKLNYKGGLYSLYQSNAYTGRFFIPGFYQKSIAPFIMLEKRWKKTAFETCLRYDVKAFDYYLWKNNQLDIKKNLYTGVSYIAQYSVQIDKTQSLKFLHSSTWRQPGPNELYANGLHQGLASLEIGDSSLLPERSFNQSINYSISKKKFAFETEVFYRHVNQFINLIPSNTYQLTIRGAFPVFKYVQSNAALYGLNFNTKWQFTKTFALQTRANIVFGDNLTENKPLNLMPPIQGKVILVYTKNEITFQCWSQLVAKQYRYTAGSDYLPPPPTYTLFGFDLQSETKLFKKEVKIGLSVSNLSNKAYRSYLNRFRYFTDEQGLNIELKLLIPLQININKHRLVPVKP